MQPSSTFRSNISSTDSASSTAATPSNCTEHGGFVLNFDDIPALSADNNSTVTPMPIFSPYHHFYFSEGFMVVPPPTDPYLPSSGKLLLEFFPTVDQKSTELSYTGSVGNGPTETLTCFNFNLLGVSLGCDSLDAECDWQFTGYRYDSKMKFTEIITTLHISTPACVGISAAETCVLIPVKLNHTFENLTSISINVTVSGESKIWWMDDLRLSWNDDSCDAGLCRQKNI
ncbi:MAG: hypothetical protein M1818_000545 [Claussenomyces sp. TS43310]|nr:MAG: hypothetical protein M1818_000545 [Claussenomyces sp. TS43310]